MNLYKVGDERREAMKVEDVLFDMLDLVLLLVVGLHLVNLILLLRLDVSGIVSGVIHEFLLVGEIHDIRANAIHKILYIKGISKDRIGGAARNLPENDWL